jgi:prolyl 4-hydroxylase
MENLQVCKYRTGDEFKLHTDHQDSFNDLGCRGRLATCLVYLTGSTTSADEVGAKRRGGETWFPGVREGEENLSIAPTQGSAVFFWNTIEKPGVEGYHANMFLNTDMRLRHAGLPVLAGEKWICNRWIHPIDFGAGVRGV